MRIEDSNYDYISKYLKDYAKMLEYGIDGYYERRINNSNFYILYDLDIVGIVCVDNDKYLTCFYIFDEYLDNYLDYFLYSMNYLDINNILFTSKDEVLYGLLKSLNYEILDQSYNFIYPNKVDIEFDMILMNKENKHQVLELFEDFLVYNNVDIDNTKIYLHYDGNTLVSLGLYEYIKLYENKACIAMIVNPEYRLKGYGYKTIQYLVSVLQSKGITPNARCYYKNIASKNTLIKAGFVLSNKLLKIENIKST